MKVFIDRTIATFELMADAIAELQQRVAALEQKPSPHETLDESDRSSNVAVGACVCSHGLGVRQSDIPRDPCN